MGGLWESGIKSTKYHLKRVVGETKLTYEELETFLTQIEACLNSRPLTPISNDPNDLSALTLGHIITGRPLTSIPEPNYIDSNNFYPTRWQQI
ncbi:integrase catalytic domain-containing protein [Trichonephila clavipes]|nr:integrase catalytic domain-containing protein [Trichonephila clavipes]